jgi:FdhD protein
VDKAIGKMLLKQMDPARCVLSCAGRLTSGVMAKAVHVGLPILASRAAPTDAAVHLARRANLTLVGIARSQRMNVYSAPERVIE